MISYPPPKFEEQKSEILQRYQILSDDQSAGALVVADSIALALRAPYVIAALNRRYRAWYRCEHGLEAYSMGDLQSYFARTHLAQHSFAVADIRDEDFFQSHTKGLNLPDMRALAGVPLTDPNGKRFGTLCVAYPDPHTFSEAELNMLSSFGHLVSNDICVRSAARYAVRDLIELEHEKCDLFELATIDPLTKALNRRAVMRVSERELARCRRDNTKLSALMLDIDHFKMVNDRHGHQAGDTVLETFAQRLQQNIRPKDIACRPGGEEFLIIMPETDHEQARTGAERIRQAIAAEPCSSGSGKSPLTITVSAGVATFSGGEETMAELMHRADLALYDAKKAGRNQVRSLAA